MRAVLTFTLAAALCIAGAWWLASLPGIVPVTVGDLSISAPTPWLLIFLALLFVVIYFVVRLIVWVITLPRRAGRHRRDRNRVRGDAAVNRTLVALAANDAGSARREVERSRRLLGDTPLTLLLAAQASRQAGREDEAAAVFQQLADRSDGRLLGLRGLLRQAIAKKDWAAAAKLAEQAEAAHPGAAWLTEERRRLALNTGNWAEALRLSSPTRGREVDAGARAALSLAAAEEEKEPDASLRLAKQAWEAQPALAPAALAYAERLRAGGRERKALDVLRRTWSLAPHPDLGIAYLAPITDKLARQRAVKDLAAVNPTSPDTSLLLARVALDAGLTNEARRHAETARKVGLDSRRLWVLLADIADIEGNAEAAQEALRHLPNARPDPVWRCTVCGTVHQAWHPICDACDTAGRMKWSEMDVATTAVPRQLPPAAIEAFT